MMTETELPRAGLMRCPQHVPASLHHDFDFYHVATADGDLFRSWMEVKSKAPGPVFWTPHNGGHWVATGGREVETIYTDYERFSNVDIFIPPNGSRENAMLPQEMDPPESLAYRSIILRPLMPAQVSLMEGKIRARTIDLVEGLAPNGQCDFVREFATILPIEIFLSLMGLPLEDRAYLLPLGEMSTRAETAEQRAYSHQEVMHYLDREIERRRATPCDDFLSRIANAVVNGEMIAKRDAIHLALNVMFGGLDTVANLLSFCLLFLARNPGHRRALIEEPQLMKNASEELIRRFGMVAVGRRIACDIEFAGAVMKKGEMILGPTMLLGWDDTIVAHPATVDFHRSSPTHMTFGAGPHVCAGQHLARREVRIVLEEWLKRIPDFSLAQDAELRLGTGLVAGLLSLPLRWA
jgi:cytochrome P450